MHEVPKLIFGDDSDKVYEGLCNYSACRVLGRDIGFLDAPKSNSSSLLGFDILEAEEEKKRRQAPFL